MTSQSAKCQYVKLVGFGLHVESREIIRIKSMGLNVGVGRYKKQKTWMERIELGMSEGKETYELPR